LTLWDADTGRELRTLVHNVNIPKFPAPVAFSPDGQRIAAPLMAAGPPPSVQVRIWDVATGQEILTLPIFDTSVKVVRLDLPRDPAPGYLKIAFSPDGKLLATAHVSEGNRLLGYGVTVRVWDALTGAEVRTHAAQAGPKGFNVVFNPDGTALAAGNT